ncbi:hypothetical protein [Burkholderia ubonensis]|uniref:hypothetical protein n=1 Tax=Burkholderia ubonensis TaxID=101571 RepID=UPI0015BB791B|nr:hypothetical protein [Burkholderia ubonensis]
MERIQFDRRAFERCGYAVIDPLQVDLELLKRFPLESLARVRIHRAALSVICDA